MKKDENEILSEVEVLLLAAKTYAMMLENKEKKDHIVQEIDSLIDKVAE